MIAVALGVTASTFISTACLTQSLVAATVRDRIEQIWLLENFVQHSVWVSASSTPVTLWTDAAIVNDKGVRQALESTILAPNVTAAAICDTEGRVVVHNDSLMKQCPSGRPASELASVNVLTVLRGTIPSRTVDYVSSSPLFLGDRLLSSTPVVGGHEVGVIRIRLSGLLLADELRTELILAAISCFAQIAAVLVVVTAASWFVFRRD